MHKTLESKFCTVAAQHLPYSMSPFWCLKFWVESHTTTIFEEPCPNTFAIWYQS